LYNVRNEVQTTNPLKFVAYRILALYRSGSLIESVRRESQLIGITKPIP
jgi:hypothetical protein